MPWQFSILLALALMPADASPETVNSANAVADPAPSNSTAAYHASVARVVIRERRSRRTRWTNPTTSLGYGVWITSEGHFATARHLIYRCFKGSSSDMQDKVTLCFQDGTSSTHFTRHFRKPRIRIVTATGNYPVEIVAPSDVRFDGTVPPKSVFDRDLIIFRIMTGTADKPDFIVPAALCTRFPSGPEASGRVTGYPPHPAPPRHSSLVGQSENGLLIIDDPLGMGASGGPVFHESGAVIGLVRSNVGAAGSLLTPAQDVIAMARQAGLSVETRACAVPARLSKNPPQTD